MQLQGLLSGPKLPSRVACGRHCPLARLAHSLATNSTCALHSCSVSASAGRQRSVQALAASASLEDVSEMTSEAAPSSRDQAAASPLDQVELTSEVLICSCECDRSGTARHAVTIACGAAQSALQGGSKSFAYLRASRRHSMAQSIACARWQGGVPAFGACMGLSAFPCSHATCHFPGGVCKEVPFSEAHAM